MTSGRRLPHQDRAEIFPKPPRLKKRKSQIDAAVVLSASSARRAVRRAPGRQRVGRVEESGGTDHDDKVM